MLFRSRRRDGLPTATAGMQVGDLRRRLARHTARCLYSESTQRPGWVNRGELSMDEDQFSLIPTPEEKSVGRPLEQLPVVRRVTSEVLAHAKSLAVEPKRVRIAGFELRAPDAELITMWASAIKVSPDELLDHLAKTQLDGGKWDLYDGVESALVDAEVVDFEVVDGELRSLVWDLDRFPCFPDLWVPGLKLQKFALWTSKGVNAELSLAPAAPDLKELWVWGFPDPNLPRSKKPSLIKSLSLSSLPRLRRLMCTDFIISDLDLSAVTNLQKLDCRNNQLTALDLSSVPGLQKLDCRENQLTTLDLSPVSELQTLNCSSNRLTALDLSVVPGLQRLECYENQLVEIDLSSVTGLLSLN